MDRSPDREDDEDRDGDPASLYLLAGWLLASSQLAPSTAPDDRVPRDRTPFGVLEPLGTGPDLWSPRELRRLPAIGPARALAIARARWELGLTGGPVAWDQVPGIGEETVGAIRRFLADMPGDLPDDFPGYMEEEP